VRLGGDVPRLDKDYSCEWDPAQRASPTKPYCVYSMSRDVLAETGKLSRLMVKLDEDLVALNVEVRVDT